MKSFKHNNTSMLNHLFHLLSKHTFRLHQNTSWLLMSLFLHAAWHRAHPNDLPEGTIRVFYTLLSQRNAYADVRAGDRVCVCAPCEASRARCPLAALSVGDGFRHRSSRPSVLLCILLPCLIFLALSWALLTTDEIPSVSFGLAINRRKNSASCIWAECQWWIHTSGC